MCGRTERHAAVVREDEAQPSCFGARGAEQAAGRPAMAMDEARAAFAEELELLAEQSVRRSEVRAMTTEDHRLLAATRTRQRAAERVCASLCWGAGLLAVGAVIARPFLTLDDV